MQPEMQQPQTDQFGQPVAQQPMMMQQPGMMAQPVMMMNPNAKSKLVAALLAIFIGVLGIHNFYLGNNGKGIAQLLITVLTFGIGSLITWPWSLIEGILLLTGSISVDGNGMPLKEGF